MENTIGISFSKNHCYLTQLSQENEGLSLTGVTYFCYEQDFFDALVVNAGGIKSFISNATRVILALPTQDVLLKNITVDSTLTDDEIIAHIHAQSLTLFGYTPDQLCIDYETRDIEESNRHITAAACYQQKISAYQRCFDQLKIPLDVIDIDVFALERLRLFLKNKWVNLTSPDALTHLNLINAINDDNIATSDHPFLISMGAGLWSKS